MKKSKLTMAQALIKFLDNQYISFDNKEEKFIEGIWAIFGHGNVLGLGEALIENKHSLKFHQGYSEQGMGHAAVGFAKQNKGKKIYAVTSSVGPGAANMVTAAATASANRIPTLFLPSDVFAIRQPDPVLQQIEQAHDLSISTNDAFKSVSVYWDRIDRPEKLMSAMINAMRCLTNPARYGAVTICLPQDVQGESFEYPNDFFKKRVHEIEAIIPNPKKINKIIELIETSKKPLIIAGGGVKYSGAEIELLKLINKSKIPISETQAGKGGILSNHDFNLGGIGTTGALSANLYASKADLIIGLGTRYSDFTTASKSLFNEKAKFINVNLSRFDAYKMDGIPVVADIKETLLKLTSKIKKDANEVNVAFIKSCKDKWTKELKRLANIKINDLDNFIPEVNDVEAKRQIKEFHKITNTSYSQTRALALINKNIANDSIVVGAAGSLPGDMQRMWSTKALNTYHVEYGYSCMGYEIAAALGVKLAVDKKTEVYALVGDGSYMMLHSELLTSVQERQKINVLLFNNSSFGCINNLQIGSGIKSLGTEFRKRKNKNNVLNGSIMHVNYSEQAKAYGVKTFRVSNDEELKKALEESKKSTVSTLIEILVLPKTMTHGYEAWWRVGNAQVSKSKAVVEKYNKAIKIASNLKGY